jgi:hypothetical protein
MPLVSISEAARLVNKDRSYFHKTYVVTGKLSVDRSIPKKPRIDTSELIRLFGDLRINHTQVTPQVLCDDTALTHPEIERLKTENEGLKALCEERKSRIEEQLERLKILESRCDRLLENKEPQKKSDSFWIKFKSLFEG